MSQMPDPFVDAEALPAESETIINDTAELTYVALPDRRERLPTPYEFQNQPHGDPIQAPRSSDFRLALLDELPHVLGREHSDQIPPHESCVHMSASATTALDSNSDDMPESDHAVTSLLAPSEVERTVPTSERATSLVPTKHASSVALTELGIPFTPSPSEPEFPYLRGSPTVTEIIEGHREVEPLSRKIITYGSKAKKCRAAAQKAEREGKSSSKSGNKKHPDAVCAAQGRSADIIQLRPCKRYPARTWRSARQRAGRIGDSLPLGMELDQVMAMHVTLIVLMPQPSLSQELLWSWAIERAAQAFACLYRKGEFGDLENFDAGESYLLAGMDFGVCGPLTDDLVSLAFAGSAFTTAQFNLGNGMNIMQCNTYNEVGSVRAVTVLSEYDPVESSWFLYWHEEEGDRFALYCPPGTTRPMSISAIQRGEMHYIFQQSFNAALGRWVDQGFCLDTNFEMQVAEEERIALWNGCPLNIPFCSLELTLQRGRGDRTLIFLPLPPISTNFWFHIEWHPGAKPYLLKSSFNGENPFDATPKKTLHRTARLRMQRKQIEISAADTKTQAKYAKQAWLVSEKYCNKKCEEEHTAEAARQLLRKQKGLKDKTAAPPCVQSPPALLQLTTSAAQPHLHCEAQPTPLHGATIKLKSLKSKHHWREEEGDPGSNDSADKHP
ncbi:hypothetical protein B0H19DRAFT_1058945 [Mycena capillaripes]|nr:hypothetical protein B0H19DRAFT_1058945 [Mycena capillaripes]